LPDKAFPLEPGGTPRLGVSWRGAFKDLSLSLDGQPVASFDDPKELKEAQRVALHDGSTLEVQVASPFLFPELRLTRDGEPVPGSSGDPATRHAAAWQMVAAVAVLNVVVGLLVEATGADFLRGIGAGWPSVFSGLVYGILAWLVRGRSIVALGAAVALFVLDGVFVLAAATQPGGTPPVGGLIARVFFIVPMLRGFPALRELARSRVRRRPTRPPARAAAPTAAPPARAGSVVNTPVARVLSGDAERQRLRMTERLDTGPAPTVLRRGAISIRGQASVDAAAAALRFLVHKVEILETGLRVTTREGRVREVPWNGVGRIVARQLPPDPPWDAGLLVDLVAYLDGRWEPLRVFTTTLVNFAALEGGASTSRLDNLRRLVRHLRERNPAVALDDDTLAFAEGKRPPVRLVSLTQLAEYDAVYGLPGPA
jgi:hypothetical protein